MAASNYKSILIAECGSTNTTAALIGRRGQSYRVLATGQTPSTHGVPWEDITLGVQEAIRFIEKQVSRKLLTPGGWPITPQSPSQQGVDIFLIVASAGQPLRTVLMALTKEISLNSARRAVARTYTHVTRMISLDSTADAHLHRPETLISALQTENPDVIVLAGGTDNGAEQPVLEMSQFVAMALQLLPQKAAVIYAGNATLRPQIADILGPYTALKSVNNVRPLLESEELTAARHELEQLFVQQKMMALPGFERLKNWSQYEVVPAYKSFERLVAFLGQNQDVNVLGASIGSRSTMVSTYHQDKLNTTVRGDVGLGQGLAPLLTELAMAAVHRWLPFELSPEELYDRLLNKSLHPNTIPSSPEDLMVEHAVAREALRMVARQAEHDLPEHQWDMIIGTGRPLTGAPHAAHAAIVLIDGLEPWGVTNLVLDRSGLVNLLGAVASVEPVAAVQVARRDTFLNLGTVIAPVGQGRAGKTAIKVKVTFADDTVEEREIPFGDIATIQLAAKEKATVEMRPARQFDIGLGQPGRGAIAQVEGGLLGLIIDARGRPLKLSADDTERQEQLKRWLKALNVTYAAPVN